MSELAELETVDTRLALLKRGIRFLMKLGSAERALILSDQGEGQPTIEAVYGFAPEEAWSEETASRTLFEKVLREGKAILTADAQQDVMLSSRQSVISAGLVSVLAVPFRGEDQRVAGLLYVDARMKAASFDYADLKKSEEFAEVFGRRWSQLPSGQNLMPPRPRRQDDTDFVLVQSSGTSENWWLWGVAFICLVFLSLGLLATFGARTDPDSSNPSHPRQAKSIASDLPLDQRPFGLARTFLTHLRQQEFHEAHRLFSQRLASQFSPARLARLSRGWEPGRQVMGETLGEREARISVARLGSPEWVWHFVKEGEEWKLDRLHDQS